MEQKYLSLIFLLLFNILSAQVVTKVIDGDTFIVDYNTTIRVAEIDCPEMSQRYGREAKKVVEKWLLGEEVELDIKTKDRYGRYIASIEFGGEDLAEQLVYMGLAWHYKYYSDDKDLAKLERYARNNRKLIWSEDNPVAPWLYRKL